MKTWIISCFALLCLAFSADKNYTYEGKITDSNGEPLIGATVLLKGTTQGTVTKIDGTFSLVNSDSCHLVVVSYTGFETLEKEICAGSVITIALSSGISLDEVVVTGLGVRNDKKEMASSTSPPPPVVTENTTQGGTLTSQQIRDLPTRNINALAATTSELTASDDAEQAASPSPPPPPPAMQERRKKDAAANRKMQLSSSLAPSPKPEPESGEAYATIKENGFVATATERTSTFAIDVDAASYSNMRRFINSGQLPPANAVRSEEMINYFQYNYPSPAPGEQPFEVTTELASCPWNSQNQLLLIGVRAKEIPKTDLPPANFVFLLDVSGSMNRPNALPLLVESLKMLTDNLREEDKVAIVVYAGASGLVLESTSGANKAKIKDALSRLRAGGSTAGAAGIQQAYQVAADNFIPGGNNRVILATDGDFNVGVSDNGSLETLIEEKRESGVFLSVLGFGRGNLQDDKMQLLADKGNGNHAYIDQIGEARKVLVSEFGGTLFAVAKDVKIQVEFNPLYVETYRQIGYENRAMANADFRNDAKDAGELGAGHTITALYEITPSVAAGATDAAAIVRLRYKQPAGDTAAELVYDVEGRINSFGQSSTNLRWAATVAEFSMLLRNSEHKGEATYTHCRELARQSMGRDPFGYRKEMVELVEKAEGLANVKKEGVEHAEKDKR